MGEYGVAFAVLLALALIGSVAIVLLPKKANPRVA
jgi:hypothetical protein